MKLSKNVLVTVGLIAVLVATAAIADDESQTVMRRSSAGQLTPVENTTGTGTQNMVARWTDNVGTLGNSIMFDNGSRVGVSTTNPQTLLQVGAAGADVPNMPATTLFVTGVGVTGACGIVARDVLNHVELAIGTAGLGGGQFVGLFGTRTAHDLYLQAGGNNFMVVKSTGAVGIGTLTPAATLDVNGSIHAAAGIAAVYQDVAEWVPTDGASLDSGTLVVLSTDKANAVRESTHAYDTAVAGVVSDKPGIILGEGGNEKAKIATTGRVKVHCDVSGGPVAIGDLLVASDRPGYAMKSTPVNVGGVKMHRPGTIIGKALEPLKSGEGDILVLLTLQ